MNNLDTRVALKHYGIAPESESAGGTMYKCPLHNEQNGKSFAVFADGKWHCFGKCSTGGDAIRFIELYKDVPRDRAIELASGIYGIQLSVKKTSPLEKIIYATNKKYSEIFIDELHKRHRVLEYLKNERHMTEQSLAYWEVGYALSEHVLSAPTDYENLSACGLLKKTTIYRPILNHRIVFPIKDVRGNIIAYTGRISPFAGEGFEKASKYINTANTSVFNKSKSVFGLGERLRELIKEHKFVVVVEGAFDAVILQQEGIPAIALLGLGSKYTIENLSQYRKYPIIFWLDPDEAGTKRILSLSQKMFFPAIQNADYKMRVVCTKDGLDPDEYVIKNGTENTLRLIQNSQPIPDYVVQRVIEDLQSYDSLTLRGERLFSEYAGVLSALPYWGRQGWYNKIEESTGVLFRNKIATAPQSKMSPTEYAEKRYPGPYKQVKRSTLPNDVKTAVDIIGEIIRHYGDTVRYFNVLLADVGLPPIRIEPMYGDTISPNMVILQTLLNNWRTITIYRTALNGGDILSIVNKFTELEGIIND